MPNFACTVFHKATFQAEYGWAETYYFGGGAETYVTASTFIRALWELRRVFTMNDVICLGMRVSDVSIPRDSVLVTPDNPAGTLDPAAIVPVNPWSCLLVRVESTPLHRGRKFLHGVAARMFLPDGTYNGANADDAALSAYRGALVNAKSLLRVVVAGVPSYPPITAVVPQRMAEHRIGRPFGLPRGRRLSG